MFKRLFMALALGTALVLSMSALAQDTTPPPDGVSITVYNEGSALVQDRRTLELAAGEQLLNFTDVAATIDATSVSFRSLTDPSGTVVLEQNYLYDLVDASALLLRYIDQAIQVTMTDGTLYNGVLLNASGDVILRLESGEVVIVKLAEARDIRFPELPGGLLTRPTLRWTLNAAQAGPQQLQLTYLAYGMGWTADYIVLLNREKSALDLNGWVTVTNTSGTSYTDAQLKLIAGNVNRIQPAMEERMYMDAVAAPMPTMTPAVQQRDLFEYKLYEIGRKVTLNNNETKQVEFVNGSGVPAQTFYVYDASIPFYGYGYPITDQYYNATGVTEVGTYLAFTTSEENGLGADLPAGRVRVYQEDIDGAALLIGENTINHTPEGEEIRLYLGSAFDLVGERIQTNFRNVTTNVIQETYEIRLRNRKESESVEIRVPEYLSRWSEWQILESSTEYVKKDASTIEFVVQVPPQGETVITYTVQYTFPR